jgi:hypothetical protein
MATDIELLDRLKVRYGLENKRQVAAYLELSESFIGKVYNGHDKLALLTKIKILDKLGWSVATEALSVLMPQGLEDALRDIDTQITKKKASRNESEQDS